MTSLFKKSSLFFSCMILLCISCHSQGQTITKTTKGYVRGIEEKNAIVFKGVPYAQAPVGKLRFKAPQAHNSWTDTLSCTQFGEPAVQFDGGKKMSKGAENCLSLNLYKPKGNPKNLPVLLWVHGGSMTAGSGSGMNGHAFADQDSIITITINYRLGVFGFLYLGDVDPAYRNSGNNGLLDLMMALQWVKENAAAFGGDPNRVTVIGESAGAKLVSTLLLTPKARDLYSQLILESGAVQCVRDSTTAKSIRQRLMQELNISHPADLLNLTADQLITAQNAICKGAQGTNYFGPVEDDELISGNPYETAKKNSAGKRFLIGTNKLESKLFMDMDKRLYQPNPTVLYDWFGINGPVVLRQFKQDSAKLGPDSAAKMVLTQYMYTMHSYRLAQALSSTSNPVWMYRFDYSKDGKGATHAQELAYTWYDPGSNPASVNLNLATKMHQGWVNFIKGRSPGENWPNFKKERPVMVYDTQSHLEFPKSIFDDRKQPAACLVLRELAR